MGTHPLELRFILTEKQYDSTVHFYLVIEFMIQVYMRFVHRKKKSNREKIK